MHKQSRYVKGKTYRRIIDGEYRWRVWAAPKRADGKLDYNAALTGDDSCRCAELKWILYARSKA